MTVRQTGAQQALGEASVPGVRSRLQLSGERLAGERFGGGELPLRVEDEREARQGVERARVLRPQHPRGARRGSWR